MGKQHNKKNRHTTGELKPTFDGFDLPAAIDVEEIVLGSILLEKEAIHQVAEIFGAELFYNKAHYEIALVVTKLYLKNEPIDIITVTHALREHGVLEQVGGPVFIASLTNRVAGTANLEYHCRILEQKYLARGINDAANIARSAVFNRDHDVFDVHETLVKSLDDVFSRTIKHEVQSASQINDELQVEMYQAIESGKTSGVPTGLRRVDNLTNGWQKPDMIVIAGRPGMGKTAIAVSLAIGSAVYENRGVAFFSLEMSEKQITGRIQSYFSGIDSGRIIKKKITRQELDHIAKTCEILKGKPLYIDDTPALRLMELKAKARKLIREKKVELIIIDYLQLMKSGLDHNNREQEVSEISRGIKSLAKELDVPIIALAQLSRSVETRGGDKKPMLSDLRESGAIEADADMVAFAYRPMYYNIETYEVGNKEYDTDNLFMLLVAKHRNGELGEIPLTFIPEQTKIVDYVEEISYFSVSNIEKDSTLVQETNQTNNTNNSAKVQPIDNSKNTLNGTSMQPDKDYWEPEGGSINPHDEPPF